MLEQIQHFQKGTIYKIRNKKTRRYLSFDYQIGNIKEENQNCLWLLSEHKNGQYEIVNFKNGESLTWIEGKEELLKLEKGRKKDNQIWLIEMAQVRDNIKYFWIRPTKSLSLSLCASALNDKIKISSIDQTLQICIWQFIPEQQTDKLLKQLLVFHSEFSGLVLQVPDHLWKQGTAVTQSLFYGGGNQRWILQFQDDQTSDHKVYTIKNFCSGFYLTAVFAKNGAKAVQTLLNCSPDQHWQLLPTEGKTFLLQSVSNSGYFLGVNNDKGLNHITLHQDREKSKWIIEGTLPSLEP